MSDASPVQGSFTIGLGDKLLTIGSAGANKNRIGVTIDYKGTDEPIVRVTVSVRCGEESGALLASNAERITVTGDKPLDTLNRLESNGSNRRIIRWRSKSAGVKLPARCYKIELKNFTCYPPGGDALIDVLVQVKPPGTRTFKPVLADSPIRTLKVPKVRTPGPDAGVHRFQVEPDFVLHAGVTLVKISFLASGLAAVSLFRNNQPVTHKRQGVDSDRWTSDELVDDQGNPKMVVVEEKPPITTVYRIEPTLKAGTPKAVKAPLPLTVQVISPGWNRLRLPQGYPTRLFVAPDFHGAGARRLYAIFVNDKGRGVLCSSATGLDDWREERNGAVPPGMHTSPGVTFKDELWLVGGSFADVNSASDQVWSYAKAADGSRRWVPKSPLPETMGKRAGHACLVAHVTRDGSVREALCVLGGFWKDYYQDVWALGADGATWAKVADAPWPRRRSHAATVCTVRENDGAVRRTIWIFGGSGLEKLTDLWSCDEQGVWKKQDPPPDVVPARTLAAALVAMPSTRDDDDDQRLFLAGTFKQDNVSVSRLYAWQRRNHVWEVEDVGMGWERFEGAPFYMQAVAFNGCMYLCSLGDDKIDPKNPPRLNVLIP